MSFLTTAIMDFVDSLSGLTGQEPKRIVLPRPAFDMLKAELAEEPAVPDGDPISGIGADGRVWLACTEIVSDRDESAVSIADVAGGSSGIGTLKVLV